MKPTIGRIVHYFPTEQERYSNNGSSPIAAVVVQVWGETCVNLKLLTDAPVDLWRTSVLKANNEDHKASGFCWDWPPQPPAKVDPAPGLFQDIAGFIESAMKDDSTDSDDAEDEAKVKAFVARIREAYPAPKTALGDTSAQGA